MTKLTVEFDKEQDLTDIVSELDKRGVKYHIGDEMQDDDEDEWGDLSEEEIEGIKAGLADVEAGRVLTHAEAMARIQEKLDSLK